MKVLGKLVGFVAVLAGVFGIAFLTGTQSQALLAPPLETHHSTFSGLSNSDGGYTLTSESNLRPGDDQFVEFAITGPDGRPVPEYVDVNDAHLHLIAFRRDLTGYQHIYPEQGRGASWWAVLNLTPGPWHLVVELQPRALERELTLATDFTVRGRYTPQPPPPIGDQADAGGGITVTRSGALTTRSDNLPSMLITEAGRPVTDLEPAHGEIGHVVIIRPGDLGYLHLHPLSSSTTGPRLLFTGGVPAPGTYAMFVEFFRADSIHVAAFTVPVTR
jgi:hypothetical protein